MTALVKMMITLIDTPRAELRRDSVGLLATLTNLPTMPITPFRIQDHTNDRDRVRV